MNVQANWFKGVRTPQKAKTRWHELCREHHPDNGGDPAIMQQIMAEYQSLVTAFAWKEEWGAAKQGSEKQASEKQASDRRRQPKTKASSRKAQKSPKKKKPPQQDREVVQPLTVAQPSIPATPGSIEDIHELIDAGAEFGKLLIKNIVRRRIRRADG